MNVWKQLCGWLTGTLGSQQQIENPMLRVLVTSRSCIRIPDADQDRAGWRYRIDTLNKSTVIFWIEGDRPTFNPYELRQTN